jgi:hypothetical protein
MSVSFLDLELKKEQLFALRPYTLEEMICVHHEPRLDFDDPTLVEKVGFALSLFDV